MGSVLAERPTAVLQMEAAVKLLHITSGHQLGPGMASDQKSPCFPRACGAHLDYMEGLGPQVVEECVCVCYARSMQYNRNF